MAAVARNAIRMLTGGQGDTVTAVQVYHFIKAAELTEFCTEVDVHMVAKVVARDPQRITEAELARMFSDIVQRDHLTSKLQWDFLLLDLKDEEQELSFEHMGRIPMRSVKLLFQVYRFQALAEDVEEDGGGKGQLRATEEQKEQLAKELAAFEGIVGDQGASFDEVRTAILDGPDNLAVYQQLCDEVSTRQNAIHESAADSDAQAGVDGGNGSSSSSSSSKGRAAASTSGATRRRQ